MGKSIAEEYELIQSATTATPSTTAGKQDDAAGRDTAKDGDSTGKRPTVLNDYPPCATYKENKLTGLRITSSLIRALYFKGEYREPCAKKVYHNYLLGDFKSPPTRPMQYGNYFESRCLGHGREGYKTEAPLLKNGRRPVAVERIDSQVHAFEMVAVNMGISTEFVQVKKFISIDMGDRFEGMKMVLEGVADIITPVHIKGFDYDLAGIDLKLAGDRDNTHGEYCWGSPQFLDPIQLVIYSYLFKIPFAYLIFDYKAQDMGYRFIPVATMAMEADLPDDFKLLARQREADLMAVVKNTIEQIVMWDSEGYPVTANSMNCERCPMNPVNNLGGTCEDAYLPQLT